MVVVVVVAFYRGHFHKRYAWGGGGAILSGHINLSERLDDRLAPGSVGTTGAGGGGSKKKKRQLNNEEGNFLRLRTSASDCRCSYITWCFGAFTCAVYISDMPVNLG